MREFPALSPLAGDVVVEATAQSLAARMDRLPPSGTLWRFVVLLSLGGFFEFYELFSTAYVMPGIIRSGILSATTTGFFGLSGTASYIGATFAGMFLGTFAFGFVADKTGRRAVFTYALLWYCACAVIMACQTGALGLNFWRLMTGIGLGVELVTIDAYLSELVPPAMRGRAFALNQVITYIAVPTVAFAAWLLVPIAPLGIDGWRWVMALGAVGALVIWVLRRALPESPRWLAARGDMVQANAIIAALERQVVQDTRRALPEPARTLTRTVTADARFRELWRKPYATRTIMLLVFHVAQAIGLYGFSHWLPTFLVHQGVTVSQSLGFTLAIAISAPLGPVLAMSFADRIERKWQIVVAAVVVAVAGLAFAEIRHPVLVVLCGSLVTLGATIISLNFHAYQSELYPTRIRAMAVGFVYSVSRVSGMFSGFLIAFALAQRGVPAALVLIAGCMAVVALVIGLLGPRTRGLSLEQIND